jgi:hypothetical protein
LADGFGLKQMLDSRIAAAKSGLVGPALLRACWPLALWIAVFLIAWLVGAYSLIPLETQALASLVFYLGAAAGVWLCFKRWRSPTDDEARDLIDQSVEGRPMEAWSDRPVKSDPLAWKLWTAHRDRMAKLAVGVKGFNYKPFWKREDPLYLRLAAPGLVILAGVIALTSAPDRLRAGFAPDFGALVGAHKLSVEAWVTPPAYTGEPPSVLIPGQAYTAPEGSEITLRVTSPGGPSITILPEDGRNATIKPGPGIDRVYETRVLVDQPMTIRVNYWGTRASYTLNIKPDRLPVVDWVPKMVEERGEQVDRTIAMGQGDKTEFGYKVTDDYGVTGLAVVMRLANPPPGGESAIEVTPFEAANFEPTEETGQYSQDLVRHRWAGLDVMVRLRATDASGRFSESREIPYKLPEKIFLQPNARAAQEIRAALLREPRPYQPPAADDRATLPREGGAEAFDAAVSSRLIRAPEGVKRAAMMLEALTYQPEDYFVDPIIFQGFVFAREIINVARDKEEAEFAEDILWSVALRAEYGSLSDATAALEAARQALENALRNGASPDEIRRLMDMYEQAVENYLAAKMADAIRNGRVTDGGQAPPQMGGGGQMNDDQLQRMLDALRDMGANGDAEAARQMLAEMQRRLEQMDNMQLQISRGGQQGQQQDGPMQRAMERAMRETGRSLNEQRDLNDQTEQAQREGGGQQRGQQLAQQQRQLRERMQQQLQSGGGQQQQGQQGGQQQGQGGQQGQQQGGQQGQQPGQGQQQGQGQQPGQQQGQGQGQQPGQQGGQRPGQQGQNGGRQGDGRGPITGPPNGQPGVEPNGGVGQETERSRQLMQRAIEAARRAEDALNRGDFAAARQAQQDITGALQNRQSELARAAGELDQNAQNQERDPLGRLESGSGGIGDRVRVPDEIDRQRARDIVDELRRRASNRALTQEELDYLRRLLEQF